MRRIPWFEILLTIAVMSISLYAALSDAQNLSWRWFTRDDAYYYFKVAQNISEGRGSTFDGINPTNGYHPLWMLVCVPIFALARFDLILPLRILLLVQGALSAGTGILLYRLIGRVFAPAIGAIAALYWVFSYDVLVRVYQQGLETGIAGFFIALLAYKLLQFERSWRKGKVTGKQLAILGLAATLTMFSRLDLVFLAGMAGLWIVFRGHTLRYFLPLDIVATFVSVLLAFVIRLPFNQYYRFSDSAVIMIGLSLIVNIACAYLFGLYQRRVVYNPLKLLSRLALFAVATSSIAGAGMIVISQTAHLEGFPRAVIPIDMALTFLLFGISRLIALGLRTDRSAPQNEESPINYLRAHWRGWLRDGIAYYGVVFGALGIYMTWNRIAFGTFSPVSGQIKRWWGSMSGRVYGGPARNELSFFGLDYLGDANAWHPVSTLLGKWAEHTPYKFGIIDTWRYLTLIVLLALVFYLLLASNKQKGKNAVIQMGIIPMLCAAFLQVVYYHSTGYSAYKEWYWVGEHLLIVITLSLMTGLLYQPIRKLAFIRIASWMLAIGFGFYMVIPFWKTVQRVMPYGRWTADQPNNDIAFFLQQHTEPGSIIGMTGGGNAGYFLTDRTVVNMDGLINSYEYFQLLQNREAGAYLTEIGMDYVLANAGFLDQLPYRGQFKPYLERLNINYGGKDLLRYDSDRGG
jgi:hypothetical protein